MMSIRRLAYGVTAFLMVAMACVCLPTPILSKMSQKDQFLYAKPGWIELVKKAFDLGYNIRFIDADHHSGFVSLPRDKAMFETLKKEIFDSHHNARVIVYIGAFHIGEKKTDTGIFMGPGKKKPLGLFLDQYTKGRNFSVYMGHTNDTPVGCDLFISYFLWNADQ